MKMKMFLMAVCTAAMLFVGSATAEAGGARFVRLANGQIVRVQNVRRGNRFIQSRRFQSNGFRSFNGFRRPQVTVIQRRPSIFDFFIPRRQVIVVR